MKQGKKPKKRPRGSLAPRMLFHVPNDEEGKEFIRLARKFANRYYWSVWPRGRNSDRQKYAVTRGDRYRLRQDLPLEYAESFAIYMRPRRGWSIMNEKQINDIRESLWSRIIELQNQLNGMTSISTVQQSQSRLTAITRELNDRLPVRRFKFHRDSST